MKYMLLVYSNESAWTESEQAQCYAESIQLTQQLQANGQYLGASPLEPVAAATSVRIRNGKQLITDGPFAETHEQLGGYFLIDARDLNEAINIAGRIPAAHKGTIEIRPVMELSGLPTDPTEKNLADLSI
ncbi:MAG: YciI family protein [Cyanobacteria bacterium J06648_16]